MLRLMLDTEGGAMIGAHDLVIAAHARALG